MSDTAAFGGGLLADLGRRVEEACDRFEGAWRAGGPPPRVEDFLAGWEGPGRAALARELIELELYYRQNRGEAPGLAQYQDRFPDLDPDWLAAAVVGSGRVGRSDGLASRPSQGRPATESPGDRVGPYKLLQRLGEGGMGTVWMAEQDVPVRRRVALKVIKPGLDSAQVIARFEAERQALALMDHPNIARVLDAGATDAGRPYFVMELVKGVPITRFCDDNRLTPRERLALFVPVCHAVQHAHQKGVIHRDIKPSNVLVALYDGRPVPKVIDFGVAKALHQKLTDRTLFTEFGQVVGTLEYMSPEQAELNALDIDTRSDVYGLGVLLYELLTGSTPLDRKRLRGAAFGELLRLIRDEEPPKPSTRLSDSGEALATISALRKTEPARLSKLVRGDLDWVVMRALEKDRNRRYETAVAFARDIEHYLADEPVEAGPPSAGYRLKKFLRRYKKPVLAAGTIALLLLAGLVGTSWGWVAATRARNAEARERWRPEQAEENATNERDDAVEQKRRADEQAAIAEAVGDFLQRDLLRQANRFGQQQAQFEPNPKLTVREALDRAAASIGDRFRDRPAVEAAIRDTIGKAYSGVGDFQQAVRHMEQAVAFYQTTRGPDDLFTLSTKITLGGTYQMAGRLADAVALLEETRRRCLARLGPDHDYAIDCRLSLTMAYEAAGRWDDAALAYEELAKTFQAKLGSDHARTLSVRVGLANVYRVQGRLDESTALYEDVFRRQKAQAIAPNWGFRNGLALNYQSAGRFVDAAALFEEVVRELKAHDGPDHPNTLRVMGSLAGAYRDGGRLPDAVALADDVLRLRTAKLGSDHPDTLSSMGAVAFTYLTAGRPSDAVTLYEEVLKLRKVKLARGHPNTLAAMVELAFAYRTLGKIEPAEALAVEALALCREHDSLIIDSALAELGLIRLAQQRYAEAEPLLRECLAIRERKAPDAWRRFVIMSLLGGALLGQQQYGEAEPLLRKGYEGLRQRASQLPTLHKPRLIEAVERLVQLHESQGRPDEAAQWRKELEGVRALRKGGSP